MKRANTGSILSQVSTRSSTSLYKKDSGSKEIEKSNTSFDSAEIEPPRSSKALDLIFNDILSARQMVTICPIEKLPQHIFRKKQCEQKLQSRFKEVHLLRVSTAAFQQDHRLPNYLQKHKMIKLTEAKMLSEPYYYFIYVQFIKR